jgi:putative endonuclease
MPYFVYIIQSQKDESYYIGSTQDLDEPLHRHNQGRSNYTKAKSPWELVYSEEFHDRSSAVRPENEIKSHKSRGFIETLVRKSRPSISTHPASPFLSFLAYSSLSLSPDQPFPANQTSRSSR